MNNISDANTKLIVQHQKQNRLYQILKQNHTNKLIDNLKKFCINLIHAISRLNNPIFDGKSFYKDHYQYKSAYIYYLNLYKNLDDISHYPDKIHYECLSVWMKTIIDCLMNKETIPEYIESDTGRYEPLPEWLIKTINEYLSNYTTSYPLILCDVYMDLSIYINPLYKKYDDDIGNLIFYDVPTFEIKVKQIINNLSIPEHPLELYSEYMIQNYVQIKTLKRKRENDNIENIIESIN